MGVVSVVQRDRLLTRAIGRWMVTVRPLVGGLVIAAGALLFLSSAGTIEIVYTIRPSYGLLMLASLAGAPYVWLGWARAPATVRGLALGLVASYILALLLAEEQVLVAQARGGAYRDLVYLADLGLGLAAVGLVLGLWPSLRQLRPLLIAMAAGAAVAALYGIYQWPAQQFDWPFDNVNNTLDSDGVSTGLAQGRGVLGWERVRGTFLEPHFLGSYLSALLPIAVATLAGRGRKRRALMAVAGLVVLGALVLASSLPSWLSLAVGVAIGVTLYATAKGLPVVAGSVGGTLVATVIVIPLVLASPGVLAPATGRAESEIATSIDFRAQAWDRALDTWAYRPIVGYGPGQSAVKLAGERDESTQAPAGDPRVLGSAQGLWSASLIDAGVLGFGMWTLFLGAALAAGGRALLKSPEGLRLGLLVGTTVGLISSEIAGDRLDTRIWLLLGALLAAACSDGSESNPGQRHQETESAADERPDSGLLLEGPGVARG